MSPSVKFADVQTAVTESFCQQRNVFSTIVELWQEGPGVKGEDLFHVAKYFIYN